MNKKTLSVLLILCMLLTMVPVTALAEDVVNAEPVAAAIGENDVASINGVGFSSLQAAITTSSAATIVLEQDTTEDVTILAGKTITLDLNGKTLTGKVISEGNLTIKDSTVNTAPVVNANNSVTYTSGKIATSNAVAAVKGGKVTLESGTIESTNLGAVAQGNTTSGGTGDAYNSEFIINGGYIHSSEFAATAQGKGAILSINGGVLETKDNAVVAGNGNGPNATEYDGDTTININGGTMIGNIKTEGYIACGVYHPQRGTLNINGGTIIANNGVGVVMRGGTMNMTGGDIIATAKAGTTGKVGDSKVMVGGDGVVVDVRSGYYDNENMKVTISNGSVLADSTCEALKVDTTEATATKNYFELSGGTYSSKPEAAFVKTNLGIIANDNGTYTVGEVKAGDVTEAVVVAKPDVEVSENSNIDTSKVEEVTAIAGSVRDDKTNGLATKADNIVVSEAEKQAALNTLKTASVDTNGKEVTAVVVPYFDIQVKAYDATETAAATALTLDIKPMYNLKATTNPGEMIEEPAEGETKNTVTLKTAQSMTITGDITLSVTLPDGFEPQVVKHEHDTEVNYYPVTINTNEDGKNVATFTVKDGFSDFTFMADARKATINFDKEIANGDKKAIYGIDALGTKLPELGGRHIGWKINGTTYTTLTEELWNAIAGKEVDAVAQFSSSGSSSGGSSSGGGAAIANKVTVTTPDSDVTVKQSAVSSSVINDVKDAVADDKNVQVVGGSSNTVNITAKQDGNTLTSFDNPLTVTVPVSSNVLANVKDTSKLTLAQVTKDANGEIVLTYVGGNYNADKKTFTAYVDEPGNYVLLADADVQKIELQIGDKASTVNGRTVMNDVAPIIVNERTMIPLRFVSEALGAQVDWNEAARTVTIKQDGVTMRMTIDKMIDGFNAAPIIRNSRTMVPVRYIAEKLGANVIYVPITQEIIVVR